MVKSGRWMRQTTCVDSLHSSKALSAKWGLAQRSDWRPSCVPPLSTQDFPRICRFHVAQYLRKSSISALPLFWKFTILNLDFQISSLTDTGAVVLWLLLHWFTHLFQKEPWDRKIPEFLTTQRKQPRFSFKRTVSMPTCFLFVPCAKCAHFVSKFSPWKICTWGSRS